MGIFFHSFSHSKLHPPCVAIATRLADWLFVLQSSRAFCLIEQPLSAHSGSRHDEATVARSEVHFIIKFLPSSGCSQMERGTEEVCVVGLGGRGGVGGLLECRNKLSSGCHLPKLTPTGFFCVPRRLHWVSSSVPRLG